MRRGDGHRRTLRRGSAPAVCLAAVIGVGCGVPADGGRVGELRGTPMHAPIPKPDLVLRDTEGRRFDLRDETEGFVTLVFFGYTHCPDVCPIQMATLGAAFRELRPELRSRIKVVFVSTDQERDTPERLRGWLDTHHEAFVGLRGPIEEINEALSEMMLPGIAMVPGGPHEDPIIGHPAAVLAFDSDGMARIRYGFGVRRSDWSHDLPLLASP